MALSTDITKDSLFDGKLFCWQHKSGYRFSIDSVLLAHFCLHWQTGSVLDLGCGCGILSLILLHRNGHQAINIEGIEYQNSLVELAQMNIDINNFAGKCKITHGDYSNVRKIYPPESFNHVICNPPFYKLGSGRTNINDEAYLARHQVNVSADTIADSIAYVLKNKGDTAIIYPAERLTEMFTALARKRLQPKRLRFIYSYPEAPQANLVLFDCRKNGGDGVKVLQPLYIYKEKNGNYSDEISSMYI